ncbi:MAG: hypothetical protein AB2796_20035, partial [Candidatus Thiodiazotropha sp.]
YVGRNPLIFTHPTGEAAQGIIVGGAIWCAKSSGCRTAVKAGARAAARAVADMCNDDACPPCKTVSGKVVPVGTIGYRPLETPASPQHGIDGPHYNIYEAHQIPKGNPVGECDCFWKPLGAVRPHELPASAIPIEPFAN